MEDTFPKGCIFTSVSDFNCIEYMCVYIAVVDKKKKILPSTPLKPQLTAPWGAAGKKEGAGDSALVCLRHQKSCTCCTADLVAAPS